MTAFGHGRSIEKAHLHRGSQFKFKSVMNYDADWKKAANETDSGVASRSSTILYYYGETVQALQLWPQKSQLKLEWSS